MQFSRSCKRDPLKLEVTHELTETESDIPSEMHLGYEGGEEEADDAKSLLGKKRPRANIAEDDCAYCHKAVLDE